MIPHTPLGIEDNDNYFYLVERPGLHFTDLGGMQENFDEDAEQAL